MGGMFSSPKPPDAPTEKRNAAEADEAERYRRLKDMDRRRRGRQGTIQTSWYPLESETPNTPPIKEDE